MPLIGTLANSSARGFGGLRTFVTPSPIPTTNLKAWYDAADTATISLSGSNVTQWDDKSGNGYHLTQGNNSLRPQSGTLTINSKNVLDFDNGKVDTLVASTASDWTFMSDTTASTTFIVWDMDVAPGSGNNDFVLATRGGSVGSGAGFLVAIADSGNTRHNINNTSGNIVSNTSTSTSATNTPVVWTIKSDPNNGTTADKSSIFKNSGTAEKNNTLTGAVATSTPASALRVGDYTDSGGISLDGQIAEIIIYSGILNGTDTTTVIDYLKSKWGI